MNEELKFLAENGVNIDFKTIHKTDINALRELLIQKIRQIFQDLEEAAKHYNTVSEDGLTHFLATALKNGCVFYTATEQNGRGHVDLTITSPSFSNSLSFKIKGEAKIWDGPSYSFKGFKQLEGYLTGNPPMAIMLYYFQKTGSCDDKFDAFIDKLIEVEGGTMVQKQIRFATTEHSHEASFQYHIDHFAAWIP